MTQMPPMRLVLDHHPADPVPRAHPANDRLLPRLPQLPLASAGTRPLIGDAPAMRELAALIARAARGTATVLVRGESGTGKELVARAVHAGSPRRAAPFVPLHCGALSESLLESELFGHERGAFTGAVARRSGRIEQADGGTLFLDEIGDISPAVQVKLLRVLQERELERVGGQETIRVNVRFVAATNRDLEKMVAAGQFREDLYYRLAVVPLWVPPLRERPADIEPLALHFAELHARANGVAPIRFESEALALLTAQRWPGNVRQLENFLERLLVLGSEPVIRAVDVARELVRLPAPSVAATDGESDFLELRAWLHRSEQQALRAALTRSGNNRTMAARLLGVSRRTLYTKLEEHQLL